MTMYKDCYETTAGSVISTKPIEVAIKEWMIKDGSAESLHVRNDGHIRPVFITGRQVSENSIPLFAHPITIKNTQNDVLICADLRFFVRKDTPLDNIEKSIKNLTEFNFAKSRLILSMIWQTGHEGKVKNNLNFAATVFAAWLSEAIAKNYALDFKDQTVLSVLTAYYYQTLFFEENTFDEDTKQRIASQVIKATKAPAEFVFSVIDKIGQMSSIEEYCAQVREVVENVRLKNFNLPMLLTIVKNSWYGTNAKEIICVALEHPPTWCAIVYAALNERTYKNSIIYRIAERFGKRGASDEFMNSYKQMILEMTYKDSSDLEDRFKKFE